MKESETIIGYSNMLVGITNKVKLLDTIFADSRIAEKILVTVPKRYEASITTLETTNVQDLFNRGDTCLACSRSEKIDEGRIKS